MCGFPIRFPPVSLVDELPWAREHVSERLTETMAVEGLTQLPECDVDNAVTTLAHVKQVVDRRLRFYRSPADLISTAPPGAAVALLPTPWRSPAIMCTLSEAAPGV